MKTSLFTVPAGIDPTDREAAREAAIACIDAVEIVARTVASALNGARVTTRARIYCLFELDKSFYEASHYHRNFSLFGEEGSPGVKAVKLAEILHRSIRKAIQEFWSSSSAPTDGWRTLWDVYRDEFGNELGPSSADSVSRILEVDVDEKGPINKATIFIPAEMMEPPWHPDAWATVCRCVEGIGIDGMRLEVRELMGGLLAEGSVKPSSDKPSDIPSGATPDAPFVPGPLQLRILSALDGKALKKNKLAGKVCDGDGSRLYKKHGIKELMTIGMVKNKTGLGYYRPDKPPTST